MPTQKGDFFTAYYSESEKGKIIYISKIEKPASMFYNNYNCSTMILRTNSRKIYISRNDIYSERYIQSCENQRFPKLTFPLMIPFFLNKILKPIKTHQKFINELFHFLTK